ncbi:reverse transcriptase domain-containing protein [Paenibacillus sp. FSL E2-0151]|uniref:reverse transcriptase domain-containing protein n=1 Tax=Paenibacillus sp. FSL E2-0151 TaxID=2921357 RepID=UPI0030EC055D
MIINDKNFIKQVDIAFWNKATKNVAFKDVINYKDIKRKPFLEDICNQINNFGYNFSKPNYYYFPKEKGILRKVKSYYISDLAIFYYCVKLIQGELYEKVSENEKVFGAFKFTSINSSHVVSHSEKLVFSSEGYESFLDKESFVLEWKEFQQNAKVAANKKYDKYVHIDISHFYDDINLDILEKEIRNVVNDHSDVIDLLFYFLKYSDKRDLRYSPNNVGIPQEEIGDMSRVLANFYLATFDTEILSYLHDNFHKADYVYMRYSDDMWFCFNGDDADAYNLIQKVSLLLGKLKLHVNDKKTSITNKKGFVKHWYFLDWNKIEKNWSEKDYVKNMLHKLLSAKEKHGRWASITKYLLKMVTSSPKKYLPLYTQADAEQLLNCFIENPVLAESLENTHKKFLTELLKQYSDLFQMITDYLNSKSNIYPNLEYFFLEVVSLVPNTISTPTIDFMTEFYLNSACTKDWHWYSRAICIKYFMKRTSRNCFSSTHKNVYRRIITRMGEYCYTDNQTERRYMMYFLHIYGKVRGKRILEDKFTYTGDLQFIRYLKGEKLR